MILKDELNEHYAKILIKTYGYFSRQKPFNSFNDLPTEAKEIVNEYTDHTIKIFEKRIDDLRQKKISHSHIHLGEQITNTQLEKIINTLDELKESLK